MAVADASPPLVACSANQATTSIRITRADSANYRCQVALIASNLLHVSLAIMGIIKTHPLYVNHALPSPAASPVSILPSANTAKPPISYSLLIILAIPAMHSRDVTHAPPIRHVPSAWAGTSSMIISYAKSWGSKPTKKLMTSNLSPSI